MRSIAPIPADVHHDPRPQRPPTLVWTQGAPLAPDRVEATLEAPGVVALVRGSGRHEVVLWLEATTNVRARLRDLLSADPHALEGVRSLLQHPADLRFRTAFTDDAVRRMRGLRKALAHSRNFVALMLESS